MCPLFGFRVSRYDYHIGIFREPWQLVLLEKANRLIAYVLISQAAAT
jgi:hypothetical protein